MLKSYFTNKRVAIVGNAESLFDQPHGYFIDGHDTVCRMNLGWLTPKAESSGVKTDLIFMSPPALFIKKQGYPREGKIIHATSKDRDQFANQGFEGLPITFNNECERILGCRPSTGSLVIWYAINAGCKEIDVLGFDFKATKTFYHSRPKPAITEKHDYVIEKEFLLSLQEEGKIRLW